MPRLQDAPPGPRSSSGESAIDTQGIRNYLLGPGDMLDVRVFGQPDLNAVVEVDSDGNISCLAVSGAADCREVPHRKRSAKRHHQSLRKIP